MQAGSQISKSARFGAIIAGILAFVLYRTNLAQGVSSADNAEFQWVGSQWGVAHPPGFTLYTILSNFISSWATSPSEAINLLSAITSAITVGIIFLLIAHFAKTNSGASAGAFILATSTTFWAQSVYANIRSLTALFFALTLLWLLLWHQTKKQTYLTLFAISLGFGITHHLSLAFMGLVVSIFVILSSWRRWPTWIRPILFSLLALLPILYLPLRDLSLRDPTKLVPYILGLGFGNDFFYFREPSILWQRLKVMVNVLQFQFGSAILILMLVGLVLMLAKRLRFGLLIVVCFVVHTFVTATYRAPQTVEYMLPAYLIPIICLGFVPTVFSGRWQKVIGPTLGVLIVLAGWRQAVTNFQSFRYLQQAADSAEYTQDLLANAPADSVILSNWHWATPLWYRQEIEKQRPDLTIDYVAPAGNSYPATFVSQIEAQLSAGQNVVATNFDAIAYGQLPSPQPLGEAFLYREQPLSKLPPTFTPLDLVYGDLVQIEGYRLSELEQEQYQPVALEVAWRRRQENQAAFSLFAHITNDQAGAMGELVAQHDLPAASGNDLQISRFVLTPRPAAHLPATYTVRLGAYLADGTLLSTQNGETRAAITPMTTIPMQFRPITDNNISFESPANESRLIGFDLDTTNPASQRVYLHWQSSAGYYTTRWNQIDPLPVADPSNINIDFGSCQPDCHYVPLANGIIWRGTTTQTINEADGAALFEQTFHNTQPLLRDFAVSVSIREENWAWRVADDSIPALGAMPTLKWVAQSVIRDPHQMSLPPEVQAGQRAIQTILLYDAFTNRPLAVLDEKLAELGQGIQLPAIDVSKIPLD